MCFQRQRSQGSWDLMGNLAGGSLDLPIFQALISEVSLHNPWGSTGFYEDHSLYQVSLQIVQ